MYHTKFLNSSYNVSGTELKDKESDTKVVRGTKRVHYNCLPTHNTTGINQTLGQSQNLVLAGCIDIKDLSLEYIATVRQEHFCHHKVKNFCPKIYQQLH